MWFKHKKRSTPAQTPTRLGDKLKKTSVKKISEKPSKWSSMVHKSFRRSRTAVKLGGDPLKSAAPVSARKPLPAVPPITTYYPRAIRCGTTVISLIRASTVVPSEIRAPISYGAMKRSAPSAYLSGPYQSEPRIKAARMTSTAHELVYDSVYAGSETEEEENIYDEIIPISSTPIRVNRKHVAKRMVRPPSPQIRPRTVFQRTPPYLDLMQVSTITAFSASPERPHGRPVTTDTVAFVPQGFSEENNVYALHGEQTWRSSCFSVYDPVASDSSDSEVDDDDIYNWSDDELEAVDDFALTAAYGPCQQSQLYSPVAGVLRSNGLKWMRRESYVVQ